MLKLNNLWNIICLICLSLAATSQATQSSDTMTNLNFNFRISSTPVIWNAKNPKLWAMSFVIQELGADGYAHTSVDAYDAKGQRLAGFPVLHQPNNVLYPSNQLLALDVDGDGIEELLVFDKQGNALQFHPDGSQLTVETTGNSSRSDLLIAPQVIALDAQQKPLLLLIGKDPIQIGKLHYNLDVIDSYGHSQPGFPVSFQGEIAASSPVIDAAKQRLFILLSNGTVRGYSLRDGKTLPGFPVATGIRASLLQQMAWLATSNSLYLCHASGQLTQINSLDGSHSLIDVADSQKLSAISSWADRLYLLDTALQRLTVLDQYSKPLYSKPLSLTENAQAFSLQTFGLTEKSAPLLLLSYATMQNDTRAQSSSLFAKQSSSNDQQQLAEISRQLALRKYGTEKLNAEQQAQLDEQVVVMQRSWLASKLGYKEMDELMVTENKTILQTFTDDGSALQALTMESIADYHPLNDTNQRLSAVFTTAIGQQKTLLMLSALNFKALDAAGHLQFKSTLHWQLLQ